MKILLIKMKLGILDLKVLIFILNDIKKKIKKYTPWFKLIMKKKGKDMEKEVNVLKNLKDKEEIIN